MGLSLLRTGSSSSVAPGASGAVLAGRQRLGNLLNKQNTKGKARKVLGLSPWTVATVALGYLQGLKWVRVSCLSGPRGPDSPESWEDNAVLRCSQGGSWKFEPLLGEELDLRRITWRLPPELIPRLSASSGRSDDDGCSATGVADGEGGSWAREAMPRHPRGDRPPKAHPLPRCPTWAGCPSGYPERPGPCNSTKQASRTQGVRIGQ